MTYNAYKLIPVKHYQNMVAGESSDMKNLSHVAESARCDKDDVCDKEDSPRNIKHIVNTAETEFLPSKHFVADFTFKPQKGDGQNKLPLFLPDANVLPEFSKGTIIKQPMTLLVIF